MKRCCITVAVAVALLTGAATTSRAGHSALLDGLQPGQELCGFSALSLYENRDGRAMGARFSSNYHGFVLDLLQMETVPQAYIWVKTPL